MSTYAEIYVDQGVSFEFELSATEDDGSPMNLSVSIREASTQTVVSTAVLDFLVEVVV